MPQVLDAQFAALMARAAADANQAPVRNAGDTDWEFRTIAAINSYDDIAAMVTEDGPPVARSAIRRNIDDNAWSWFDAASLSDATAVAFEAVFEHSQLTEVHGISAFGATLVDDVDAATARTTLGLGTIATQNANNVAITGGAITGTTIDGVSIKSYVDNLAAGVKWKAPVVAATTAPVTLATALEDGDTLDGVVLATGDRILVKDQADPVENGIYVVAASGAPTRALDADSADEIISAAVFASEGAVNADRAFVCTSDTVVVGSTSITFVPFASALGALLIANNLSDLGDAATARTNLGLGTIATSAATDFVNTTGNQTGIAGDKAWTGQHTFNVTAAAPLSLFRTGGTPGSDELQLWSRSGRGCIHSTTGTLTFGVADASAANNWGVKIEAGGNLIANRAGGNITTIRAQSDTVDSVALVSGASSGLGGHIRFYNDAGAWKTSLSHVGDGVLSVDDANAGVAVGLAFRRSSSTTNQMKTGGLTSTFIVNTHASRTGRVTMYATDFNADREFLRADATGTGVRVGLLGDVDGAFDLCVNGTSRFTGKTQFDSVAYSAEETLTDGANISWDVTAKPVVAVTLEGDRTLDNPTNMVAGGTFLLRIIQGTGGTHTLAYGTAYKWPGGVAPTLSGDAGKIDLLTFYCDGTNMYGVSQVDFS